MVREGFETLHQINGSVDFKSIALPLCQLSKLKIEDRRFEYMDPDGLEPSTVPL